MLIAPNWLWRDGMLWHKLWQNSGDCMNFTVTIVDPLLPLAELPDADRILHVLDFSLLPQTDERYVVVASRGLFDEEAIEQALT